MISIQSGIPHLLKPAKVLLEASKGTWLDQRTPENFTLPFVRLLLALPEPGLALTQEEQSTFEGMKRYLFLEQNIDRKIQTVVPWTPSKTRGVGDRKRKCEECEENRSETMMHDDLNKCGMCVDSDTKNPKDWKEVPEMRSCWVECSERICKAQYVIEDEEGLRVRFLRFDFEGWEMTLIDPATLLLL